MSIVNALFVAALEDTKLLKKNSAFADDFSIPRDVDFLLLADDRNKAETVTSFINDNCYGNAKFSEVDGHYRISVIVFMPTTQNVLCSISGLMVCLAQLFNVEYDGWGCVLQQNKT